MPQKLVRKGVASAAVILVSMLAMAACGSSNAVKQADAGTKTRPAPRWWSAGCR